MNEDDFMTEIVESMSDSELCNFTNSLEEMAKFTVLFEDSASLEKWKEY